MGATSGAAGHGRRGAALAVVLLVPLALLAIIGTSVLGANESISIRNLSFAPNSATVDIDDLVTWTNNDAVQHTVTSPGIFDFGPILPGASRAVSFRQPRTYEYGCTIHTQMKGTIVVLAAAGVTPEPEPTVGAVAAATAGPEITSAPTDTIGPGEGSTSANLVGALATILAAGASAFALAFRRASRPG